MKEDVDAEIKATGMSAKEAHKNFSPLAFGVPDRVRERLTAAQRKTLKELLGPPHNFNP